MLFLLTLLAVIPDVKHCGEWEICNTIDDSLAVPVDKFGTKPFQSTDYMFWMSLTFFIKS